MSKLINSALAEGKYNNILTSITSNVNVVNIEDSVIGGIDIVMSADKVNWNNGNLTYIVKVDNSADKVFDNTFVRYDIDNNLVEFIDGSVMINDVPASEEQYVYDLNNNTLVIKLDSILPYEDVVLSFDVRKKYTGFFILKSDCTLYCKDYFDVFSNYVTVLCLASKFSVQEWWCGFPRWRG